MPDGTAIPEPKLPDNLAVCYTMLQELLGTHGQLHKRIRHLEHQLEQLQSTSSICHALPMRPSVIEAIGDEHCTPAMAWSFA